MNYHVYNGNKKNSDFCNRLIGTVQYLRLESDSANFRMSDEKENVCK